MKGKIKNKSIGSKALGNRTIIGMICIVAERDDSEVDQVRPVDALDGLRDDRLHAEVHRAHGGVLPA